LSQLVAGPAAGRKGKIEAHQQKLLPTPREYAAIEVAGRKGLEK
jgi:hypothetical protein